MAAARILVRGFITMPRDQIATVMRHLDEHVRLTRAEAGCLKFNANQDGAHPERINVDEAFVDRAAFEAHQARTGKSVWADVTKGMLRTFDITEEE